MWALDINSQEQWNILTAIDLGLKVPEFVILKNLLPEEQKTIEASKDWIIRKDFAIHKAEGIPLSTFAYYNNGELSHRTLAIMNNYLLSGDQGQLLDGNMITVWHEECKIFNKYIYNLCDLIAKKNPEFTGIIGISGFLKDKKIWYNRIHFGVSEDFIRAFCELEGISKNSIKEYLLEPSKMSPERKFGASLRLWSWPKANAFRYISASGESVKKAWTNIYIQAKETKDCYRIDGGIIAKRTYKAFKEEGFI